MTGIAPQFLDVGHGAASRRIAVLQQPGAKGTPGVVWLQGFKSDMVSTKAAALAQWASARDIGLTRFDYSGHGQSGGRFEDGTLGRWIEEAHAVFERLTRGPQVLVGSSMGGGIALQLLRRLMVEHPALAARIKALVLIAPAWDMTEALIWHELPEGARREVIEKGQWLRPSEYGDAYPITRALIEDGRRHALHPKGWNPGRPISILHGRLDPDVPFTHSERLVAQLSGGWTKLVEVPDGEHRLSRPEEIAKLIALIEQALSLP